MTPAELRCLREYLGLPPVWLATYLGLAQESTLRRMESGRDIVLPRTAERLRELAARTDAEVAQLVADIEAGVRRVVTYRTDADYRAAGGREFPASWHRAAVSRALDAFEPSERPRVVYAGQEEDTPPRGTSLLANV